MTIELLPAGTAAKAVSEPTFHERLIAVVEWVDAGGGCKHSGGDLPIAEIMQWVWAGLGCVFMGMGMSWNSIATFLPL